MNGIDEKPVEVSKIPLTEQEYQDFYDTIKELADELDITIVMAIDSGKKAHILVRGFDDLDNAIRVVRGIALEIGNRKAELGKKKGLFVGGKKKVLN